MDYKKEKEILRKQLSLLAEYAQKNEYDLISSTHAMCEIVYCLKSLEVQQLNSNENTNDVVVSLLDVADEPRC